MDPGLIGTQNTMAAGLLQLTPIPPANIPQHYYDQSFFTTDGMLGIGGGYIYFRDDTGTNATSVVE